MKGLCLIVLGLDLVVVLLDVERLQLCLIIRRVAGPELEQVELAGALGPGDGRTAGERGEPGPSRAKLKATRARSGGGLPLFVLELLQARVLCRGSPRESMQNG